jgi:hypothetical protein
MGIKTGEEFARLMQIQDAVVAVTAATGISTLQHDKWREYCVDRRVLPHQGFVDGDAVERFLDFTRAQKAEVLKKLQAAGMTFQNVEEITEEVESIYRLH